MPRWWQSPVRSSKQRTGTFDPTTYRDRYQEALRELIEAKMKGVAIKPREVSTPPPVIDLMAALNFFPDPKRYSFLALSAAVTIPGGTVQMDRHLAGHHWQRVRKPRP